MTTSDPAGGVPLGFSPEEFAAQIARVANELFAQPPGALAPAAPSAGLPVVPVLPGPSALKVGAGGLSPGAANGLPVPGALQAPPIAAAPLPKESDLRNGVTLAAEQLNLSPVAAASPALPESASEPPYFLAIAGLPAGLAPATEPSLLPNAPGGLPAPPSTPLVHDAPGGLPAAPSTAPGERFSSYDFSPILTEHDGAVPELSGGRGILDPYAVKRDFPILSEKVHGKPLVWLDNAATTQKPRAVIERLTYYYEHENSNVHRAAHALAARATDAYESGRTASRRFLNAPSNEDIVFVRGATEAINLVAKAYGGRRVGPGDEIVITWLEHHANIVPWQQLCAEKGARLRVAPVSDDGQVILEEFERLLGPKTRIVAIPHVSNALGTILPVREMTEIAHRYGACVLVDGAQAVSHMPVDVQAIDCDFYVFSGHKVFAPTGIGVLYGKSAALEAMPPWQGGGNMIKDVRFEKTVYQPPPSKFEAGTGSIADAAGLGAAIDYVMALGMPAIARYEHELLEYGTECLSRVPGLTLIGTAPDKAGVLSFTLDGHRTEDVGAALDADGIAVRSGHHCAQPILRRFGLESTVRASLAPYNTREDLDALTATLLRLQAGKPVYEF